MVADIGEAEAGGDPDGPGGGAQQHRLRDAVGDPGAEDGAGPVGLRVVRHGVGVVADPVPHGVEERHGLLAVGGGTSRGLTGKGDDVRMIGVDEVHRSNLGSGCYRQIPQGCASAPVGASGISTNDAAPAWRATL